MMKLAMIILLSLLAYHGQAQTVKASNAHVETGKNKNAKTSVSETANIPMNAKQHFSSTHGNAEQRTWTKEGDGGYRTTFTEKNNEYTAHYSKSGKWLSDERHLQEINIPLPIIEAFKSSKYQHSHIEAYSFVKNDTYPRGVYVLTVTLGGKQTCLYYSAAGHLLRTF